MNISFSDRTIKLMIAAEQGWLCLHVAASRRFHRRKKQIRPKISPNFRAPGSNLSQHCEEDNGRHASKIPEKEAWKR